jgi:hypothetical protein
MTPITVKKLEEAFAIGCSDEEACFYADISKQTLYDYQKLKPEFIDRKEALKAKPVLLARQTMVKNLYDPNNAKWFLEKKLRGEFGLKAEIEHSGAFTLETLFIKSKEQKKGESDKT